MPSDALLPTRSAGLGEVMVLGATARNTSRSASRHSLGQWERIAGRPVVRPRLAPLSRLALLDLRRALRGLV